MISRRLAVLNRFSNFCIQSLTAMHGNNTSSKHFSRESYAQYERDKYLKMSTTEKRTMYKCAGQFVTLDVIPSWRDIDIVRAASANESVTNGSGPSTTPDPSMNAKVSLWRGDITSLEIDAIVNAANKTILGGGGVDGAIHKAAGPALLAECSTLGGCETGAAKITGGYRLPAKYIIHTVGPIGEDANLLSACYKNSLALASQHGIRTIAFPCISTGAYGYSNDKACQVVLSTTRKWLENNSSSVDRIVFCVFLQTDLLSYQKWLPVYFPK